MPSHPCQRATATATAGSRRPSSVWISVMYLGSPFLIFVATGADPAKHRHPVTLGDALDDVRYQVPPGIDDEEGSSPPGRCPRARDREESYIIAT